jgi:hypothetical protein
MFAIYSPLTHDPYLALALYDHIMIAEIGLTCGNAFHENSGWMAVLQFVTSASSMFEGARAGIMQGKRLWVADGVTQLPDQVVNGNA